MNGEIVFCQRGDISRNLTLPCGRCIGCRLERSRQWAIRCVHEASLYEDNCFITLTYNDASLPSDGSLDYSHFQRFMKRLRRSYPGRVIRFYMCGEYGSQMLRPHFHACLFNLSFPDMVLHSVTGSGSKLYRSDVLDRVWGLGFASIGDLNFETAAYCARYVMKKITGSLAADHYRRIDADTGEIFYVTPEFNKMSLKPGVGAPWFDKFGSEVFPHDRVVLNGTPSKPPKFYDKLLERFDPLMFEDVQFSRFLKFGANYSEQSEDRLSVREACTDAKLSRFRRGTF